MSKNLILIIVFGIIWIAGLLISGFLALWWKNKFKIFKAQRNQYYLDIASSAPNYQLKKIKIDYKLPDGEVAYIDSTATLYWKKIKAKHQETNFFANKFKNDSRSYYGDKKLDKQSVRIIVTNKNLLLELEDDYLKVTLDAGLWIKPITFSDSQKIIDGLEIIIDNKRFLIDNDRNITILHAINILKGEFENE